MNPIKTIPTSSWQESFSTELQRDFTQSLEQGQLLYFPNLKFGLTQHEQQNILSPACVNSKAKNVSFNKLTGEIRGLSDKISQEKYVLLHSLLDRFAEQAQQFIHILFPNYKDHLKIGRTSFRPVEVNGRKSSVRKDDKRLHVDAFPASPNQGLRILRVFCNINPHGQARVWRLGEPFEEVVRKFLPRLREPLPISSTLLYLFRITRSFRTLYDHYMLQLHDNMKADNNYQRNAKQLEFHFPPQTTWVVQTDDVSHAAMSGQHLLEQTFYLPINAMLDENKSPLRVLERFLKKKLV